MTDLGLTRSHSVVLPDWHHPSLALGPLSGKHSRLTDASRSSLVLRSFFAFKAKNDRRTSVEEAEKHRVSTGVGQPVVMPQGGEWVLLGDT